MKRQTKKYLFLFNVVIICIFGVYFAFYSPKSDKSAPSAAVTSALVTSRQHTQNLTPTAKSSVLIDAKSGAVLYEKDKDTRLPMASTTKIMTAICVIENSNPNDVITVTSRSTAVEGSKIYITQGEKITVLDLLYGLMLESGNDAAIALAIGVFSSVDGCVLKMNELCEKIGLVSTNFTNVHGLYDENHYTTAYELALITKYAMQNDLFRKIFAAKNYVTSGQTPRYFSNHNKLLLTLPGCNGGKTGYTKKSGRCLVSSSCYDDREYIAVTLGCSDDWREHTNMHTFAKNNFYTVEIANKDCFKIYSSQGTYILPQSIYLTCDSDEDFPLNYKITIQKDTARVRYFDKDIPLGSFGMQKELRE